MQNLEPKVADQARVSRYSSMVLSRSLLSDYMKFIFYFLLLVIPVYAIVRSVIDQNWLMVIIDILLIPVGFIHGLLLLFGVV